MYKINKTVDPQDLVQYTLARERFYRSLVIRLGVASAVALTGWSIYLCFIINRLLR